MINLKYKNWYQVVEVSKKENILRLKALVIALTNKKDIIKGERLSQEVNIEITTSNLESAIIQRLVEDKNMQNDLINLNHKLKEKKNTKFYTDGVLAANRDSENINRIGIGWVFKEGNRIDNSISFSSSIENWPSLTCAELGAIWTAILVAPINSRVLIYTDSNQQLKL